MKVLVACEESQRVCIAFRKQGHEAYSCDIESCSGNHPEWHIKGDVLPLLNGNCFFETADGITHCINGRWDLIIAHPPCTYLTNTGNRWFNIQQYGEKAIERYRQREQAAEFFMAIWKADCDCIAIENPIGYMSSYFRKPDQIIHPYYFAEYEDDENCERKATCLWLRGIQPLTYTIRYQPRVIVYKNGKGTDSPWHMARSKTFKGIAKAMALQWGSIKNKN